jgi:hypothetical protein
VKSCNRTPFRALLLLRDRFTHLRRRHGQFRHAYTDRAVDGVGDRCGRRHNRHLTDPTNTDRMPRIRHLNQNRFDHREVQARRHAVVKKSRVPHRAALIVVVFFVERPADTLSDTTLDLPFDVTGMHRLAHILRRRVTQDLDLAGLRIEFAKLLGALVV